MSRLRTVSGLLLALVTTGTLGCSAAENTVPPTATATSSSPVTYSPVPTTSKAPTPDDQVAALVNANPSWVAQFGRVESYAVSDNRAIRLVTETCFRFDKDVATATSEIGRWIYKAGYSNDPAVTTAAVELLAAAIPLKCPKYAGIVEKVRAGDWLETIEDGVRAVKTAGMVGAELRLSVTPGTYRLTEPATGCYWERSSHSGKILANQYATAATTITVTIRPSDGAFTSRSCGTWTQVK